MPALSLLLMAALSCAPPGRPIVTEVYYDAPGVDTGYEFVELWNPGDAAASLAGVRLEAGDGAGPGRWTLKWTGGAADSVAARAHFVIGGALVEPLPNRVITLDLQNGPDAMRLVWPDGAIEVVGWGEHDFPEYFCGAPAIDVPGGRSLARVPDDAATGSNAGDFRAADPSPGATNVHARDAALVRHGLALDPAQPDPGAGATLTVLLTNAGLSPWAAGEAHLTVASDMLPAAAAAPVPAIAAGETTAVAVTLAALREGRGAIAARIALPGDEAPANDADTLLARVGPGPLELTEIQFHPAASEGEWVEVRNRSTGPLDLDAFKVGDHAGARGAIEAGVALLPDSLAVLAQNPGALLAEHVTLDGARVRKVTPWAALNNSDGANGVADEVVLAEADGVPDERVSYSGQGIAAGITLERSGNTWLPSPVTGGTPLAPPRTPEPVPGGFHADPSRLRPGHESVRFTWDLPWPAARVTLELYDLDGRRTRRLAGPVPSGPHGERPIALDDLTPGLYLAVLRADSNAGALTRIAPLRVEGAPR